MFGGSLASWQNILSKKYQKINMSPKKGAVSKGKACLPTIHFAGALAVSFWGSNLDDKWDFCDFLGNPQTVFFVYMVEH